MKLSASQAAREVGKSVQTITRAIEAGRLSADGPKGGPYQIERSEVYRVWSPKRPEGSATAPLEGNASNEITPETRALQAEVKALREMLDRERDTIADLRTRLDAEGEERRKLTALLTHQPSSSPAEATSPRRRWPWRS